MPLVIKSQDDDKKSPHLALCHEAQGFSANNRHVSLLMKSGVEITEEITKALEVLGLNKAAFYSQIRTTLQDAVKKKYADDKEWLYVEDFNDSVVIFCNEKGLWSTTYSLVNGEVSLGELANPVTSVLSYVPSSGNMLLSEDAEDKLEEGVYGLVTKALQNEETQKHLSEMWKAQELIKEKEVLALQEEIQKAVKAAEDVLKAQLKEKDEALEKALSKVAEFEKAQKEAVEKARKDAIAEVEKDAEKAEALFKASEALSDEAFDVIVKSLKAKEEQLSSSDLFVQKSKNADMDQKKDEENGTLALLKKKYAQQ